MDQYLDIRVLPDPEFTKNVLLGALVSKLHRGLVEIDADDIGVSFPRHDEKARSLGDLLRIHGSKARLSSLMENTWLRGMADHIEVSQISEVPKSVRYRVVSRRQFKTNADRLRRRRMKRNNETWEEAVRHIPDSVERNVKTPFVVVRSASTGNAFSLFIQHGDLALQPMKGQFSTYGLSKEATIPWF